MSLQLPFILGAQLNDNFEDGDITFNPQWQGDVEDFVVHEGRLRLDANAAGMSRIASPIQLQSDFEWSLDIEMEFAPSASNRLIIYLWSADEEFETDFLSLSIGENGSDDAIVLSTSDQLGIASGLAGRVATDPVLVKLKVTYLDGFIKVNTVLDGETLPTQEIEVFLDKDLSSTGYFGLECRYTSTRADRYYFDNVIAQKFTEDTIAPQIIRQVLTDDNRFCLFFDELVDIDQSEVTLTSPQAKVQDLELLHDQLKFGFSTIPIEFDVSLSGIVDFAGNEMDTTINIEPSFEASIGDLLINEVLFNPDTGGSDFVELVNVSDRNLSLSGLVISNNTNGQERELDLAMSLGPNEILAFTPDKEDLLSRFPNTESSTIIQQRLPALNNDEGNVSISFDGQMIDTFDYHEDFHHPLLDEEDGVSLERIALDQPTNEPSNWGSASETVGFATPGAQNSIGYKPTDNREIIVDSSFSPNGDGVDDELGISIQTIPNVLANLTIYTDRGQLIRTLTDNLLLGTDNQLTWDGRNDDGQMMPIGIYIMKISLFDPSGYTETVKKPFALRQMLN